MAIIRTKGSLAGFSVRPETTYGVVNGAGTDLYGGTLRTFSHTDKHDMQQDPGDGTMVFSSAYSAGEEYGFSAEFTVPSSLTTWTDWIKNSVGSLTGFSADIPSFSTVISVASDEHFLYTGCKINSLEISGGMGEAVVFKADVIARDCTISATRTFGGKTFSAVTKPAGAPITKNSHVKHGASSCSDKTFSFTIGRQLKAEGGLEGTRALSAGLGSVPQTAEAKLSFTVASTSSDWDILKKAGTAGATFSIVLGGKTITLTKCYFETGDIPARSQSPYDETIGIIAGDVSVA